MQVLDEEPHTPTDFASLLVHTGASSPIAAPEHMIEIPVEDVATTITGMQMLVARRYVVLILIPWILVVLLGTAALVICALIPNAFVDRIQWRNSIIGCSCALAAAYLFYLLLILIGAVIAPSEAHLKNCQLDFKRFIVSKEGLLRYFIAVVFLPGVAVLIIPLIFIFICCFFIRCCSRGSRAERLYCSCYGIVDVFDFFCDCGRCGDCGCGSDVLIRCFCCLVTDIQDMKGAMSALRCLDLLSCLFYCCYLTKDRSYVYQVEQAERDIVARRTKKRRPSTGHSLSNAQ